MDSLHSPLVVDKKNKIQKNRSFLCVLLVFSALVSLSVRAEEPQPSDKNPPSASQEQEESEEDEDLFSADDYDLLYLDDDSDDWLTADETQIEPVSSIDIAQKIAGSRVRKTARWVDSFFADPNYTADEADGRVVFTMSGESSYKDSEEFRMKIDGNLYLPGISKRLELIFSGNDDLDINDNEDQTFADAAEKSSDNPSVGLRYAFFRTESFDARMTAGVRFGNQSLFAGPRLRYTQDINDYWLFRVTQLLRWYTNDGWKSGTDVDFDRRVRKYSLFRQRFSTDWNEDKYDDQGFRHSATTSYTHPLPHKAAMRYSWTSVYLTRYDGGWRSTRFTTSYRRAMWRDWFILEAAPFISFDDEYGWDPNPGIKLSVSLILEAEERTKNRKLRSWKSLGS